MNLIPPEILISHILPSCSLTDIVRFSSTEKKYENNKKIYLFILFKNCIFFNQPSTKKSDFFTKMREAASNNKLAFKNQRNKDQKITRCVIHLLIENNVVKKMMICPFYPDVQNLCMNPLELDAQGKLVCSEWTRGRGFGKEELSKLKKKKIVTYFFEENALKREVNFVLPVDKFIQ